LLGGTHDLQELINSYFQITLARMRFQHSLLLHYVPSVLSRVRTLLELDTREMVYSFSAPVSDRSTIRALDFEKFSREAWAQRGEMRMVG